MRGGARATSSGGGRSKSGELIVADSESKDVQHTRVVKRVPIEQRWSPDNLEWITAAPWNMGQGDAEASGDRVQLDVRSGPGRRLIDEEKRNIVTDGAEKSVHPAHLWKRDFEKHGFTDRCPGCSSILRGISLQPHSKECRQRVEEALASGARLRAPKSACGSRPSLWKEKISRSGGGCGSWRAGRWWRAIRRSWRSSSRTTGRST